MYSEDAQIDFIITYYVPWYVSFYASWCFAEEKKQGDLLRVVYDEIVQDWLAGIKNVLKCVHLDADEGTIQAAMDIVKGMPDVKHRINKGIPGC